MVSVCCVCVFCVHIGQPSITCVIIVMFGESQNYNYVVVVVHVHFLRNVNEATRSPMLGLLSCAVFQLILHGVNLCTGFSRHERAQLIGMVRE